MALAWTAPAAAYTAIVYNDTEQAVEVDVEECSTMGMYNPIGRRTIAPGMMARYESAREKCLCRFKGRVRTGAGAQTFQEVANPYGYACSTVSVHVRKGNHTYYFTGLALDE